jgi:integrase
METSNLKRRHQTWFARVAVPRSLRAVVGRAEILRSLKTRDLREANRRKHRVLAEIHASLSRHVADSTLPKESADYVLAAARSLRESVASGETTEADAEAALDADLEKHLAAVAKTRGVDPSSGDPLLDEQHERTLRLAHQVFNHGDVTLLSEAITKYLREVKPRITKAGYGQKDKQLHAFAQWLRSDCDVTSITKKIAGRYVSDMLQPSALAPKSKKDTIANLSAFWSWLEQYGLVEVNPWRNMTRAVKESTRGGRAKPRPYTPQELGLLIGKLKPGSALLPLACIAAYSGMRIEEIAAMKTEHLTEDAFRVMEAKNENSVRYVPIHGAIAPMVKALTKSSSDGYLISGLLPGGADGKRSHYASRYFGNFLRKHGFTDKTLTFHSLRRSFAQRCEQAGIPESTAKLLTGHARQSLTYGLYSPGPEFPILTQAVEKVSYGETVDARIVALAKNVKITHRMRARARTRKRS